MSSIALFEWWVDLQEKLTLFDERKTEHIVPLIYLFIPKQWPE